MMSDSKLFCWIVGVILLLNESFGFQSKSFSRGETQHVCIRRNMKWPQLGVDNVIRSTIRMLSSTSPENSGNRSRKTVDDNSTEKMVEFRLHNSIASIPSEAWNACLTTHSSPFLEHAWLRCLEESKCASPSTGWVPQHISVLINGETVGYVPLYIKGHSLGEFIFDQGWAEAAYQSGIEYYPKMLVGVPFTPATGHRMLWHSSVPNERRGPLRRAVGKFLKELAISNKISSVHFNFLTEEEATDLAGVLEQGEEPVGTSIRDQVRAMLEPVKDGYLRRTSIQYHWMNRNPNNDNKAYENFEEYLSCFKSKRRINIKRERRYVHDDENIRIDAIRGKEILQVPGLVSRMFEIYLSTIEKMYYGRQYLTVEFFELLAQSEFIDNLCFMCARSRSAGDEVRAEDVFAGTFNIIKDGVFYGRYWGCIPSHDVKNLHFETCYWSAIEYCINEGLERMEPGAGGGDYKWARGFDPALIHSVHYLVHPGLRRAVARFLRDETSYNTDLADYLNDRRTGKKTEEE